MRVPLSLRIFLVSVAFTVASGVLAFVLVTHSFQRYYERWERSVATLPAEQVFGGSASEIARSLLLRLEREPEVKERDKDRIALPAIKVSLQDPAWSGFGIEAYLFASLVYFAFCYAMSAYSRR